MVWGNTGRRVRRRLTYRAKASRGRRRTAKRVRRAPVRRKYGGKVTRTRQTRRARAKKAVVRAAKIVPSSRVYEVVFKTNSEVSNYNVGRYPTQEFNLSDPWNPMPDNTHERAALGLSKIREDGYNKCVVIGTVMTANIVPLTATSGAITYGWMRPTRRARKILDPTTGPNHSAHPHPPSP